MVCVNIENNKVTDWEQLRKIGKKKQLPDIANKRRLLDELQLLVSNYTIYIVHVFPIYWETLTHIAQELLLFQ